MPRKRYLKRQTKPTAPAPERKSREYSPAAKVIAQRMSIGGIDYLKQNLIRIMADSAKLAEEIEFRDLYLDGEKAAQVTERWLKKYDKRLDAVRKKSSDKYHEVADEMRVEIIAELATPDFRKEVDQRLQTLMDRLMTGSDTKKLETVMMLTPALRMKSIPWGFSGLILAIYNRTMQRSMQEYEEDQSIFDAVAEALKAEGKKKLISLPFSNIPTSWNRLEKRFLRLSQAYASALKNRFGRWSRLSRMH